MSVVRSSNAPINLGKGKPIRAPGPQDWVRPSDWLSVIPPQPTEQKFVGLIAVFDQTSNYVALRATVSSGTYTVDWGDGTSTTHTSNTNAEKNYVYSNLSSDSQSSRGYRQALVTVTPTTAGATFSLFGLNYRHSARSSTSTVANWLDVAVSAPNATTLRLGGNTSAVTRVLLCSLLERATIVSHNTTSMLGMFANCYSLASVPLFNTANVTDMGTMFSVCYSLKSVPLFNTASVTNMQSMFSGCSSLESVPLFNTASVTNMFVMLSDCSSLKSVPLFNTASVITMGSMFSGCSSLTSVPLFNTANVTNMGSMFSVCVSLESVPLFNTASVTEMQSMFNLCLSLTSVPLFNTASVITMGSMFSNSASLNKIDELNLIAISSATNNNMRLTLPSLGKAKLSNMRWTQSFNGANMGETELNEMYTALAKLNPNVTTVTGNGTTVTYTVDDITAFVNNRTVTITDVDPVAYNLTSVVIGGVNIANKTFNVTNAATETYVSGGVAALQDNRLITVTGNPGVATDDPTIATNKGWQVTG